MTLSDEVRAACEPLPTLKAELGQDMRQALLQNRAESELVHTACTARHRGVLRAVGSDTLVTLPPPDRWAEFQKALAAARNQPKETQ